MKGSETMGKFNNSTFVEEVDAIQRNFKENILDNPFQKINDSSKSVVTYYSLDREKSTIDIGSGSIDSYISNPDSPLKWKKIDGFILYGLEKILLNMDMGEMGLETSEISGEALIMYNTIVPSAADYFIINHTDLDLMFRVTGESVDTLPNGANSYKISYQLMHLGKENIELNVTGDYNFVFNNVGTGLESVIQSSDYNKINKISEVNYSLITYYKDLFYNNRVNSFILNARDVKLYDQYITQFFIDTGITSADNSFLHIGHELKLDQNFKYKYDKSFFGCILRKDLRTLAKVDSFCYSQLIEGKVNIFYTRYEEYCKMVYEKIDAQPQYMNLIYEPFSPQFIQDIIDNKKYGDTEVLKNIIIKYFNSENISDAELDNLNYIDMLDDIDMFYMIPCVIYILEGLCRELLSIKRTVV